MNDINDANYQIELEYKKAIYLCKIDEALQSGDRQSFDIYSKKYNNVQNEIETSIKYLETFN